jgi:hypothetical protein
MSQALGRSPVSQLVPIEITALDCRSGDLSVELKKKLGIFPKLFHHIGFWGRASWHLQRTPPRFGEILTIY